MRIQFLVSVFIFLLSVGSQAQKLSPLALRPDWSQLEAFQETITADEFLNLLEKVYCPDGSWRKWINVNSDGALIFTSPGKPRFWLKFAREKGYERPIPRYWRTLRELPPPLPGKPLSGLHIAIDAGHLGGKWAKMEERWFQIGGTKPVTEGDMTLYVAKLLRNRLSELGARVSLVRDSTSPVTKARPKSLRREAIASLRQRGIKINNHNIQKESELLFYRTSEIRARGNFINQKIRPDLVLCLHFNAEEWGDPARPKLTEVNHLHLLVSGGFGGEELEYEDQRMNMLIKLLNRSHFEEVAIARKLADTMSRYMQLPPFLYKNPKVARLSEDGYIWGRNLLATRLYECPVIFAEPYVMNNIETFARIQAGDYEGLRVVGGMRRPSIYREYAEAVVQGLINYYKR